jgi:carbonic anhydrase/acetyltransferase-like protein (isoleucine patch superfamily)
MKYLLAVILACSLLPIVPVSAETVLRTGETVSVDKDQSVEGHFYALGSTVTMSGTVSGDLVAAGGNVSFNGGVGEDVVIIATDVGVYASVTDDVRIVAWDTTIDDSIGGSVLVIGGKLNILSTATIGGDVLFVGGTAIIEGEVKGALLGNAEAVRVDAVIGKGIDMNVHSLTLGDRADVTGNVQYTSSQELVRSPNAVVTGEITRTAEPIVSSSQLPGRSAAILFLISLFASLCLFLVARRPLERVTTDTLVAWWERLALGLAGFVLLPITSVVLLVSVLGLWVGLVVGLVFAVMLLLAVALSGLLVGTLLSQLFMHNQILNPLSIVVGTAVVHLILYIPVVGPFAVFVIIMTALGGLLYNLYKATR